jgi:HEAT repeat protein
MIYTRTPKTFKASRLLAGLLLSAGVALAIPNAKADAQSRDLLSRFAPAQNSNDPSARAFTQGRSLIDEGKWAEAAATFERFVADHPSDRNTDAALFWLAYAHDKQKKYQDAEAALDRLIERFPRSAWADDARTFKFKIKAKRDPQSAQNASPPRDAEAELQIVALNALCQNDRARCSSLVGETLRSNRSPVVKEAAIKLLGRYGGAEAVPALIQLARSEQNEKLRMSAIGALSSANDERAVEVLREIAMSATFDDESPADSAIHALVSHESPRALQALADVIINGRNPQARQHAVDLVSRRRGDDVVDLLFRVYDTVPDAQIKLRALGALGNRRDPRAAARLAEIARTSPDPAHRKQAVRVLANRGGEGGQLDVLLSLFDSERDLETRAYIIEGVGRYEDRRATQKLMQIVRNPAEPIELRKRALSVLSRSKDPEVMRFLEEMIK